MDTYRADGQIYYSEDNVLFVQILNVRGRNNFSVAV
jgi:hypothetical protein